MSFFELLQSQITSLQDIQNQTSWRFEFFDDLRKVDDLFECPQNRIDARLPDPLSARLWEFFHLRMHLWIEHR